MAFETNRETVHNGKTLSGKYQLLSLIGKGGMGAVYLAEHLSLKNRVAVKLLHQETAKNETAVKRFYREAQAAAAIGHPNIVSVIDLGRADWGEPFIVMEYLQGSPLGDLLDSFGSLSHAQTVAILEPVLSALEAAHAKGIVHRDLKPDNIFLVLQPDGHIDVKVIDFGISKFTEKSATATKLTQAGDLIGTPLYMSPEQVFGNAVDQRTDVYAMGVILYEMLTGQRPFAGQNYTALLYQVLNKAVQPPRTIKGSIPRSLDKLVMCAMARPANERFPTIAAMNAALAATVTPEAKLKARTEVAALLHELASTPPTSIKEKSTFGTMGATIGEVLTQSQISRGLDELARDATVRTVRASGSEVAVRPSSRPPMPAGQSWLLVGLGVTLIVLSLATIGVALYLAN